MISIQKQGRGTINVTCDRIGMRSLLDALSSFNNEQAEVVLTADIHVDRFRPNMLKLNNNEKPFFVNSEHLALNLDDDEIEQFSELLTDRYNGDNSRMAEIFNLKYARDRSYYWFYLLVDEH